MRSVSDARKIADRLLKLEVTWAEYSAKLIFDLADQLEYFEERDTVSDGKIALLQAYGTEWKDDAMEIKAALATARTELEIEKLRNLELRKQVQMLKAALLNE